MGKKIFLFFISAFLLFFLSVGADDLVAKVDQFYPPYEYIEDGHIKGFNVDIFKAVADRMDLQYDIRADEFGNLREELEKGSIDIALGMFYSKDRDKYVDFSLPHSYVHHTVFIRKDSEVRSLEYIKGLKIAVQEGDIMHDYIRRNPVSEKVIVNPDQAGNIDMLAQGQVDAVLGGHIFGLFYLRKKNLKDIVNIDKLFEMRKYCFAVREGDKRLKAMLDEGLVSLRETGQYESIAEKWFGPLRQFEQDNRSVNLSWLYYISGIFIFIIFLFYLSNIGLKRVIRKIRQDLQVNESILSLAFENNSDGEILVDFKDLSVKLINHSACELFEIDTDSIGKDFCSLGIAERVKDESGEPYSVHDNPVYAALHGKEVVECEVMLSYDGKEGVLISFSGAPVFNDDSDIVAVHMVFENITEKKKVARLMLHNEKMISIAGLAAGMAHEINNPLSGITQGCRISEESLIRTFQAIIRKLHKPGWILRLLTDI